MRPIRSILYIPANNEDWVLEAPEKYDADAFIFDLEDSVPPSEKEYAREVVADAYEQWDTDKTITVRLNAPDTGLFEADLDAVVHDRLDAVIVPKLPRTEYITRTDHVLSYLEARRGIDSPTEIVALPETPRGFYNAHELCQASDRVAAIVGGTSRGADVERALGWEWTEEGTEKLHMLSKVLLDGKAAGVEQFFGGAWTNVEDIEGLRTEAERLRSLGYTGYQVIHPSHVEPINEIFTPDEDDVAFWQRVMEAMETAELEESRGAVRFEGEMIDVAHIKRGEDILERARAFDMID
ncbi:CoA ester lyase [Natrinema sp. CBA1119]|uniref:HpcH/HpaI aldolase/citrate lyase family protein n=1 Tax=Natrinema sp. CBA1119 TaxID=1608465 RepID=UPI000BF3E515|nr:CoA ester lyase [Natrinema sp. CBA1119]PGF17738.1 CoA ester lyase [Natrinema sp. CBA1119]